MVIALFGGSFDPPHIGHQMACLYVLETHQVDELWMIPCYRHPFEKRMAPFAHRVAMCKLTAEALSPRVRVSTIEEELSGPSYTLTTVQALCARYKEHQFRLVIGADLLQERERWYGAAELMNTTSFIVIGRSGNALGSLRPERDLHHSQALELPAVSSTQVRSHLAAGQKPRAWLPRRVLSYIDQHELYMPEVSTAHLGCSEKTDVGF